MAANSTREHFTCVLGEWPKPVPLEVKLKCSR